MDDWLKGGLPGRSERTHSVYREALKPLMGQIGGRPLRELTAGDVRAGLEALSDHLSTRYLQIAKTSLARAIRYAEAHDLRRAERGDAHRSAQGCGRAAQPVADPGAVARAS